MIAGHFDLDRASPVPIVNVAIQLPDHTSATERVEFVIDTGATVSCLHPFDAARFRILPDELDDPALWAKSESHGGVGGTGRYYVVRAFYGFTHEDGNVQSIEGQIRLAQFTRANAELPSLLGWDILQHFRLTADWRTKMIALD